MKIIDLLSSLPTLLPAIVGKILSPLSLLPLILAEVSKTVRYEFQIYRRSKIQYETTPTG